MNEQMAAAAAIYREAGRWRVIDEPFMASSPLDYAMEEAVGEAVASGEEPATLRIWQGPRALVVAKKDIRTPRALNAALMMSGMEWPVYVRQSGGTAVPHGPGTLNLSLFLPRPKEASWNIDDVYRMLGLPLMRMAKETFGLDSYFGEVPGSFCDGRYNVVIQGKKVVGTSQVWKGGPAGLSSKRPGYILAHATLLVHAEREAAVSALNAFYEMAEGERPVYIDTVATLDSFISLPAEELEKKVRQGLLQAIDGLTGGAEVTPSPSNRERGEASRYLARCRPEYYGERPRV
ncbi:lipoate--protein ligase family protein [Salinithrix halophila]|uniref:Biotin/lipoate A/B protein ligase family protein n=1 Tax=Salinithrix halophila TaxID=1485204 RepID=A0ABV8JES1_9BACL